MGFAAVQVAVTVAAAALQAASAIKEGQAASNVAKFNAKVAENNAIATRQQAAEEEARQRRESRRDQGKQRAAFGKAGVTLEGSPLEVLQDSTLGSELDAQTTRHIGLLRAQGFINSAELQRAKAKSARSNSFFRAGTALLGGASKAVGSIPQS